METNLSPKIPKYACEFCQTKTNNKKDFDKHLMTAKHLRWSQGDGGDKTGDIKNPLKEVHACEKCNKKYKSRNGLWKHTKSCLEQSLIEELEQLNNTDNMIMHTSNSHIYEDNNEISTLTCLVIEVVKNNSEFQKQMFDMCKNMQANIINSNNNTTNNNTFNLQVFLNEYCKDAMNINDFVDSFDLQISDLESVGRLGYIEGMSNIIIGKIKELDVNKRPIHCSDLKREIIYIKDDDKWEREDANNSKFRKVIKRVSGKNIDMLNDWKEKYPEYEEYESAYNDIYMKLIIASMGGEDISVDENKIIKRVAKHVVIDKKAIADSL